MSRSATTSRSRTPSPGTSSPSATEQSRLFHNVDGRRFVDASATTGLLYSGWTGDACPVDANGDGWPDLYVTNMQGDDAYYENAGGPAFLDKSRAVFPKTPWGTTGIAVFDFNNDGRSDILVTDMHSDMYDVAAPAAGKAQAPRTPAGVVSQDGRPEPLRQRPLQERGRRARSARCPTRREWKRSGRGASASATLTPTGSRTSSSPPG